MHISEEQPIQPNPRLANYRGKSPYWTPWTTRCFLVRLAETSAYISHCSDWAQSTVGIAGVLYIDSFCLAIRDTDSHTAFYTHSSWVKNVLFDQVVCPSVTALPSAADWVLLPRAITQVQHTAHVLPGWGSSACCASVLTPIPTSGTLSSGTIRIRLKAWFTFPQSTVLLMQNQLPRRWL